MGMSSRVRMMVSGSCDPWWHCVRGGRRNAVIAAICATMVALVSTIHIWPCVCLRRWWRWWQWRIGKVRRGGSCQWRLLPLTNSLLCWHAVTVVTTMMIAQRFIRSSHCSSRAKATRAHWSLFRTRVYGGKMIIYSAGILRWRAQ